MIKGISIRNFMSYIDAYVPLKEGLNLICGPNGSGKSSILLAISLVLGQAYTERAKKLSDLIRWGEEEARLTLTIENKTTDGRRLFPRYRSEIIDITRVLKRRGDYYYLINGRVVNKGEIIPVLKRTGLNPDNALIVMHQLMLGKFGAVSPQDKLRMLEEATGIQHYRESITEAQTKLREVMSEERKLLDVLESTEETREFWRREYEKLLKKRSLEEKIQSIKRDIAWAKVNRKEQTLLKFESRIQNLKESITKAEKIASLAESYVKTSRRDYKTLLKDKKTIENSLFDLVKEHGVIDVLSRIESLNGIRSIAENLGLSSSEDVRKRADELKNGIELSQKKVERLEQETEETVDRMLKFSVEYEVESFKLEYLRDEEKRLAAQRMAVKEELQELMVKAEHAGPRVDVTRNTLDLMLELNGLETMLKPLLSVNDQVENTYLNYSKVADELKAKSEDVKRNREEILKELSKRRTKWRSMMEGFLSKLEEEFNHILGEAAGEGRVKITNPKDTDKSGLDIFVGFKGVPPTSINDLTQSGGERSIALMAFLLALQRNIHSPLRAIDEFDVHLDPKNRDLITQLILSSSRDIGNEQYIAITPGRIRLPENHVHVIVVQNVEGASIVTEGGD